MPGRRQRQAHREDGVSHVHVRVRMSYRCTAAMSTARYCFHWVKCERQSTNDTANTKTAAHYTGEQDKQYQALRQHMQRQYRELHRGGQPPHCTPALKHSRTHAHARAMHALHTCTCAKTSKPPTWPANPQCGVVVDAHECRHQAASTDLQPPLPRSVLAARHRQPVGNHNQTTSCRLNPAGKKQKSDTAVTGVTGGKSRGSAAGVGCLQGWWGCNTKLGAARSSAAQCC